MEYPLRPHLARSSSEFDRDDELSTLNNAVRPTAPLADSCDLTPDESSTRTMESEPCNWSSSVGPTAPLVDSGVSQRIIKNSIFEEKPVSFSSRRKYISFALSVFAVTLVIGGATLLFSRPSPVFKTMDTRNRLMLKDNPHQYSFEFKALAHAIGCTRLNCYAVRVSQSHTLEDRILHIPKGVVNFEVTVVPRNSSLDLALYDALTGTAIVDWRFGLVHETALMNGVMQPSVQQAVYMDMTVRHVVSPGPPLEKTIWVNGTTTRDMILLAVNRDVSDATVGLRYGFEACLNKLHACGIERLVSNQDSKEKAAKEKDAKEKAAKEKDAKEKDSKGKAANEKDAKEKDAKEKAAKEKTAKEKEAKRTAANELDAKEQDAKEKDSKEKVAKEKEAKTAAKEKEAKRIAANEMMLAILARLLVFGELPSSPNSVFEEAGNKPQMEMLYRFWLKLNANADPVVNVDHFKGVCTHRFENKVGRLSVSEQMNFPQLVVAPPETNATHAARLAKRFVHGFMPDESTSFTYSTYVARMIHIMWPHAQPADQTYMASLVNQVNKEIQDNSELWSLKLIGGTEAEARQEFEEREGTKGQLRSVSEAWEKLDKDKSQTASMKEIHDDGDKFFADKTKSLLSVVPAEVSQQNTTRKSGEPGITDIIKPHPREPTEALASRVTDDLAQQFDGTSELTRETILQNMYPRAQGEDLKKMDTYMSEMQSKTKVKANEQEAKADVVERDAKQTEEWEVKERVAKEQHVKNQQPKSVKEKHAKENDAKEKDAKEKNAKEKDSKEKAAKEKDAKEKHVKEKDSKEKDAKEKDTKEKDAKEKLSEKKAKEKHAKEKETKEKAAKEKDAKEKKSKEKDAKEKMANLSEKEAKEKHAKEKDAKEKAAKEKDAKEKETKEKAAKEKDAKEKKAKEKDAKEKMANLSEKEAKEKHAKEKDAKEKDAKEKDAKEKAAKEKDAKEEAAKEKAAKEKAAKEKAAKEKVAKEKAAKEKAAKEKTTKEKPKVQKASKWQSRLPQLILIGIVPSLICTLFYFCYCRDRLHSRDVTRLIQQSARSELQRRN